MEKKLLAIDQNIERFNNHRVVWAQYGVMLERVSLMEEAILKLNMNDAMLVGISADTIENYLSSLPILRHATAAPIFVLTLHKTVEEHKAALKRGANVFEEWVDNCEDHAIRGLYFLEGFTKRYDGNRHPIPILFCKDITIYPDCMKTLIHGKEIELSNKEYDILRLMLENKDQTLTFEQIFENVWGTNYDNDSHGLVWNQVLRLRKKINHYVTNHDYIQNQRFVGYRLSTPDD